MGVPPARKPVRCDTWANPEQLVGTTLDGRYRVLRVLGAGGMGAVFEAEQTTLHKRVAIKVLAPRLARNADQVERFLREAQAASRVSNMHVVDISDFGRVPSGSVYYVMELLPGPDLHHIIRTEGRLPWVRAKTILLQICHALAAAHDQGVVHRDIKPANCVILPDPDDAGGDFVKVVDFGIAKIFEAEGTAGLTRPNEIMGTVAYMAPEQALCRPVDERTDVYALGVVAFEMLTGRVPFHGEGIFDVLEMHCHTPPPSLTAIAPDISPTLDAVVQRALKKHPQERFPDMRSFEQALRSIADEGATVLGPADARPSTRQAAEASTGPGGMPIQNPTPLPHIRPPSTGMGVSNFALLAVWIGVLAGGIVLGAWIVFRFMM
ncbi:MAG: serine/threonine-protein kinase [Nannocystales bacterium]